METVAPVILPTDVEKRLKLWRQLFHRSVWYHNLFGIGGMILSVCAASLPANWSLGAGLPEYRNIASILAALCFGLIGFLNPERRYVKFVSAWRILDLAAMRYRAGLLKRDELYDAVERGEKVISAFEDATPPQKPPK